MRRCYREKRLSGLGSSTLKAQRASKRAATGPSPEPGANAASNGAAIRIAPSPITRPLIRDVCRIHHHEEAYVGALAVVLALRRQELDLPDSVVKDRLNTPGYVADSVPAAIHYSHQILKNGFPKTLATILRNGGDTDRSPAPNSAIENSPQSW